MDINHPIFAGRLWDAESGCQTVDKDGTPTDILVTTHVVLNLPSF